MSIPEPQRQNDNLFLISGVAACGKTASLRNLKNPEGVIYVNTEGKKASFKTKFMKSADGSREFKITDPLALYEIIEHVESMPEVHTIVVDSLTFLMDMYYTIHIENSADTQKGWGNYKQFFVRLMLEKVANSSKNFIFLAHTVTEYDEIKMANQTYVKVQGSIMSKGVESYFSTVVSAKAVDVTKLSGYKCALLNITPQDEALGYKYVFQTQLTKESIGERIRSPIGMWDTSETFIDNDAQMVLDRLIEFHED